MEAVVFDFDGVVCDSMAGHAEAYRRVLAPLDVPVEDREVYLLEGARSESIIRQLTEPRGIDLDDDEVRRLADEKQRVFREVASPTLYPGAVEMVRQAQSRWRTGLVTGTRRENLEHLIPELLPGFDAVLAQDAYTHDKPHPEPYAKAAEAIGVDAGACVAVENAVRGVQSAQAAGYAHVVAITTTLDDADLAEADHTIHRHEELVPWLTEHSL